MPLVGSHGNKVAELLRKWHRTGKIGMSRPATKDAAVRQANAVAYAKERK